MDILILGKEEVVNCQVGLYDGPQELWLGCDNLSSYVNNNMWDREGA